MLPFISAPSAQPHLLLPWQPTCTWQVCESPPPECALHKNAAELVLAGPFWAGIRSPQPFWCRYEGNKHSKGLERTGGQVLALHATEVSSIPGTPGFSEHGLEQFPAHTTKSDLTLAENEYRDTTCDHRLSASVSNRSDLPLKQGRGWA